MHWWHFPFEYLEFLEIVATIDGVFDGLKSFWIVTPSCSKSRISPDVHNSIGHSNTFKDSLDFDFWDGFCSSKLDIIKIALNSMSFKDESCNHSFISLVFSSINYFPARSDGNRNEFFFSNILSFPRLATEFPHVGSCYTFPIYIVLLVFRCSPRIDYLVECFHLSLWCRCGVTYSRVNILGLTWPKVLT